MLYALKGLGISKVDAFGSKESYYPKIIQKIIYVLILGLDEQKKRKKKNSYSSLKTRQLMPLLNISLQGTYLRELSFCAS